MIKNKNKILIKWKINYKKCWKMKNYNKKLRNNNSYKKRYRIYKIKQNKIIKIKK